MSDNETDPSFLDGVRLTEDQKKRVFQVTESKEVRILAFSRIQSIFLRNSPKSIEEAAARYYEAQGLMSLIKEIK